MSYPTSKRRKGWFGLAASSALLLVMLGSCILVAPAYGVSPLTLTSPNVQASGVFGYSVAVGGSLAIVGAVAELTGSGTGRAYVYNTATGALVQTLTSPNQQYNGYFGSVVAISGDLAIVGADGETANGFASAGHAYVFDTTTGALVETLTSPNAQTGGDFGLSVGISGKLAIASAPFETSGGLSKAGNVYVFNAVTGKLVKTLTSPNAMTNGYFGWSVATTGTLAAVGAPFETSDGLYSAGNVYLFNPTTGALVKTLVSPDAQSEGIFGVSVAMSGSMVCAGAWGETADGFSAAGHAYVFDTSTGALVQSLTSPAAQLNGDFGWTVAISGSLVGVGAWRENSSGLSLAGNAYVFNAKTGALLKTLTSPNAQEDGQFGLSVGISGKVVAVGAPYETVEGLIRAGHAYIFAGA